MQTTQYGNETVHYLQKEDIDPTNVTQHGGVWLDLGDGHEVFLTRQAINKMKAISDRERLEQDWSL